MWHVCLGCVPNGATSFFSLRPWAENNLDKQNAKHVRFLGAGILSSVPAVHVEIFELPSEQLNQQRFTSESLRGTLLSITPSTGAARAAGATRLMTAV